MNRSALGHLHVRILVLVLKILDLASGYASFLLFGNEL